ncbi:hypothetical protein R1flu_009350 [Riccia fluitans]|uniref:Uncharacterized protein n=1 Tax=Riccia fluitans TaxID=41844 RepID=A0ABD1Z2M6_9MARC
MLDHVLTWAKADVVCRKMREKIVRRIDSADTSHYFNHSATFKSPRQALPSNHGYRSPEIRSPEIRSPEIDHMYTPFLAPRLTAVRISGSPYSVGSIAAGPSDKIKVNTTRYSYIPLPDRNQPERTSGICDDFETLGCDDFETLG